MSRGNGRQAIFLGDVDRQDFLKSLAETCEKTGFQAGIRVDRLLGAHGIWEDSAAWRCIDAPSRGPCDGF